MKARTTRSLILVGAIAVLGALMGAARAPAAVPLAHPAEGELELPAVDRMVARLAADARAAKR